MVTRCPTILILLPVYSLILRADTSPRKGVSSISNQLIVTGKPNNSISSYTSSIFPWTRSGREKSRTGEEKSGRILSGLFLLIIIWASHKSTAFFFPVNLNAPAFIRRITCSSPGFTLVTKSFRSENEPSALRITSIDWASLYSRLIIWMNPRYMSVP